MAYAGDSRLSDKGDMANFNCRCESHVEYVAFGSEIVSATRNWTANVTSTAVETSIDSICLPALAFSMLRGASLSTLEIFDIARGQKRAFCRFDYVVLFTHYQRKFNGQSLRQNFFPMQNTLDRSYRDRYLIQHNQNWWL